MTINVPANAPPWMRDFAQSVENYVQQRLKNCEMAAHPVSDLPDASEYFSDAERLGYSKWIFITDETGGAVPAFTDGTDWRRATDRNVAS